MPALKIKQFESYHVNNSLIGRALAHAARLKILEVIMEKHMIRNTDLVSILQLSQTSVSNHIKKLIEADLVELTFTPNSSYYISLKVGADETVKDFVTDLFG